jgi:hypothetical protein
MNLPAVVLRRFENEVPVIGGPQREIGPLGVPLNPIRPEFMDLTLNLGALVP